MSVLVVGGGKMGLSHLAILSRLVAKGEVALCDSSRAMRFVYGRFNYTTFRSLDAAISSETRWKGAVVATPTGSHYSVAKTLIEKGIACLIEKPLTLDPAKSQELVDLARERGVAVQMGLVGRFIGSFLKMRWIVGSRSLGRPLSYRAEMLGNVITRATNNGWRTVFARGGGCLNEYGPHLIDLCRYFFGNLDHLRNASARRVFSTEADDAIDVSWVHDSGCEGRLSLDWCDSSKRKAMLAFSVEFEMGTVRATNTDLEVTIKAGAQISEDVRSALAAPLLPISVPYYLRGEEFTLQLETFLGSLSGHSNPRRSEFPINAAATIMDGLEADRLIHKIATMAGLI